MSRSENWETLKTLCVQHNISSKGKYGTNEAIMNEIYRIRSFETLFELCGENDIETELNENSDIESLNLEIEKINKYKELKALCDQNEDIELINYYNSSISDIEIEIKNIDLENDKYSYLNLKNRKVQSDNECVYAVCEDKYKNSSPTSLTLHQLTDMINNHNPEFGSMPFNEEQLNGSCLKPFFDLDFEHNTERDRSDNEKNDRQNAIAMIRAVYHSIRYLLGTKGFEDMWLDKNTNSLSPSFNINMVAYSSSCGKKDTKDGEPEIYKNSFHLNLVCGIVMKNGAVMKKVIESPIYDNLMNEFKQPTFTEMKPDMSVYVGEGKWHPFRMPFGRKIGSTRGMIPQKLVNNKWEPYKYNEMTKSDVRRFMVSIGDYSFERIYFSRETETYKEEEYSQDDIMILFNKMFPDESKHHKNPRKVNYTYENKTYAGIGLSRSSGSNCPLCSDGNRKTETDTQYHGRDSNVLIKIRGGKYLYSCRWSKKIVCLNPDVAVYKGHESTTDTKQPEKKELTADEKLAQQINKLNEKKESIIEKKDNQFKYNTTKTTARYVSEIPELISAIMNNEAAIIAVSASMGQGKTRMIAECMNKLKSQNESSKTVKQEIEWAIPKSTDKASTQLITDLITQYSSDDTTEQSNKILVSVMRIALAKKFSSDFTGFKNYLDEKDTKITDDYVICQLDSFNRLNWTNTNGKSCRCVIFDEVDQQRKHLLAKTYSANPKVVENIAKLKYIVRNAEQVVIMSANISQDDINWIKSMREDKIYTTSEISETGERIQNTIIDKKDNSTKIFINKSPDMPKYNINITTNKNQIQVKILKDLINRKKVYLAHNFSDSLSKELKIIFRDNLLIKEDCEYKYYDKLPKDLKILDINSSTINNPEVISALNNPNEEFGKYDLILASPSVQSGVSYDIPNMFDSVYGYFNNSSSESGDACQALRRIRHPINNTITVCINQKGSNKIVSKSDLKKAIINNREVPYSESVKLMNYNYNQYGTKELIENIYLEWYLTISSNKNFDSANYIYNFVKHQIEYGNTVGALINEEIITDNKEIEEHTAMMSESALLSKKAKKERKDDWLAEIIEAPLLSNGEYLTIKEKKTALNHDEKIATEKFFIHNAYGINPDVPHDQIAYGTLSKPQIRQQYKNAEIYGNKPIEQGLEQIREFEISRELSNRQHTDIETDTTSLVIKSLSQKFPYNRHKIIAEWMKKFNIKSYDYDGIAYSKDKIERKYTKEQFDTIIEYISKEYLLTNKALDLNIQISKQLNFKQALYKINSIVESEFAFKFVRIDAKLNTYGICFKKFITFNENVFTNLKKSKSLRHTNELLKQAITTNIECADVANMVFEYLFSDTPALHTQ